MGESRAPSTVCAMSCWAKMPAPCTVRRDSVPRVVAALRNTVLGLFHQRRWRNIAAALRHYAWHPVTDALRFLGISLT
jgi:hypothetical protein